MDAEEFVGLVLSKHKAPEEEMIDDWHHFEEDIKGDNEQSAAAGVFHTKKELIAALWSRFRC